MFNGSGMVPAQVVGGSNMPSGAIAYSTAGLTNGSLPGSTHFFTTDQVGTAQLEFAAGGWPVWQGEFTPYGGAVSASGPTANNYQFTGQERDQETADITNTGLDFMNARYYSSTLGRFTTPDPSGLSFASLANPQSFNLYSYALNNPLIFTDPSGLTEQCFTVTTVQPGPVSQIGTDTDGTPIYGMGTAMSTTQTGCYDNGSETSIVTVPDQPDTFGGNASPISAPSNGTPGKTYPLLNTQSTLHECGADAKAAAAEQTGKILDGNWIGTTAGGVILRAVAGSSLTFTGVAEGAAFSFGGRALWYGAKGLFQGATTGGACAIGAGATSLFNSLTGPG